VTSVDAPAVSSDATVFAAGVEDAAPVVAEAGPKKVRVAKVKPCVRCEERRAREREYAKSSRLRQRLATAAPPTTPADGAAVAPSEQPASADDPAQAST